MPSYFWIATWEHPVLFGLSSIQLIAVLMILFVIPAFSDKSWRHASRDFFQYIHKSKWMSSGVGQNIDCGRRLVKLLQNRVAPLPSYRCLSHVICLGLNKHRKTGRGWIMAQQRDWEATCIHLADVSYIRTNFWEIMVVRIWIHSQHYRQNFRRKGWSFL